MLTETCLQNQVSYFACQIADLGKKYHDYNISGNSCAKNILCKLEIVIPLLDQVCNINLSTETCLSEYQITCILDKIKQILDKSCECGE